MARKTKKDPATPDEAQTPDSGESAEAADRDAGTPPDLPAPGEVDAVALDEPGAEPEVAPEAMLSPGAATSGPGLAGSETPGAEAPSQSVSGTFRGASTVEAVPDAGSDSAVSKDAARPAQTAEPPPERPAPYATQTTPASGGSGGFVAGLLGGALAVAAGVGALWLSNPDLLRGIAPDPDFKPIEARIEAQEAEGAALASELADLRAAVEAAPAATDGGEEALARVDSLGREISERIDGLAAEVASLSARLEVLDGRIGQVEVRPPVMEGGAAEATAEAIAELRAALDAERAGMDAAIAETRARIDAATAEAEALREAATASQKATLARAAYSRLTAALDAGGPFAGALADLGEVSGIAVPPELAAAADTGVPTMDDLRRSFPDAARAALNAAIRAGVDAEAGAMERIGAFLRAQTGARSIAPREGDDPDAVLSRAEAALAAGQLDEALALIDTLPAQAQAELAEWRAAAERRREALAAAEALSSALPAN